MFIIFNSLLRRFSNKVLSVSSALNNHFLSFPSSFQLVNIEGDLIKNNHLRTSKKTDSMVYRINTEKEGFMLDNDPRTLSSESISDINPTFSVFILYINHT